LVRTDMEPQRMIQPMSFTVHTWEEDEEGSNVAWEFEMSLRKQQCRHG
jgi:hypothetical protein